MTKMRKSAARRKGRLAGLLLLFYMVSLLMGQVCMTASALGTEDASAVTETSAAETAVVETIASDPEVPAVTDAMDTPADPEVVPEEPAHPRPEQPQPETPREDAPDFVLEDDFEKKPLCGLEEHIHSDSCYDEDKELICGIEEHTHLNTCYPACGIEAHKHTDECRDEEGNLICEKEEHTHDEIFCYADCGKEEHVHTRTCLNEEGELICGKERHVHNKDCCPVPEKEEPDRLPTHCGKEEHNHGRDCYDTDGNLICTREEHNHGRDCYLVPEETQPVETEETQPEEEPLYCGKEEHAHSESCEDAEGNIVCGLEAHKHDESCYVNPDAPVTYCGMEEHRHDESCQDENGNIVCGKREHTHDDTCYVPVYCGHVAHKHDALCLGEDGQLICGLEEHTHEESCYVEVPEGMALTCGKHAHTHSGECYDQEGNLVCTLEDHTHTEDCFSPILEGTVYYPVEDPSDLDPNTAYLIMGGEEEVNYLLTADLGTQPVAVMEGVDAEGTPCVQLSLGAVPMMAALSLEKAEDEPVLPDSEATDAPEELADELKWVPGEEDARTLCSVADAETQVALTATADGVAVALAAEDAPLAAMNDVSFFAVEPREASTKNVCDNPETCDVHIWEQWNDPDDPEDDVTNMNPFGDAHNYNLFVLHNFVNYGPPHGNAAIGGDFIGNGSQGLSYDYGSNNDFSANITELYPIGLWLGGNTNDLVGNARVSNGTVIAVEGSDTNITKSAEEDNGHFHYVDAAVAKKYFEDAEKDLLASNKHLSEEFGKLNHQTVEDYINPANTVAGMVEHEGRVRYLMDGDLNMDRLIAGYTYADKQEEADLFLVGTSYEYNVFNIPASMLTSRGTNQREVYLDVPYGSYTVINVIPDGEGDTTAENFAPKLRYMDSNKKFIDMPADKSHNDNYRQTQRTLINFDQNIKNVTIGCGSSFIYASIMGPQVDMVAEVDGLSMQGNIVLGSLTGRNKPHPDQPTSTENAYPAANNATIFNPFQVSGQATFNKYIKCLACEEDDDCLIHKNNSEYGGTGNWNDYRVDLTLQSIDHVGGEPRTFELKGLRLDGEVLSDTFYLAPGNYLVAKEQIYKIDANGNRTENITDEHGNFLDDSEHLLKGAYFGRFTSLPSDEEAQGLVNSNALILNIAPYINKRETIVNIYGDSNRVTAIKRWVTKEGNIELATAPPEGAFVTFRLYKQQIPSEGEAWPAPVPVEGDEGKRVDAETNWIAAWDNLDSLPSGYRYVVMEESDPWPGYTEVTRANGTYQYNERAYSPYYDTGSNQWIIKNTTETDKYSFTVQKGWTDQDGNPLSGSLPAVQVQLYQLAKTWELGNSKEDILTHGSPYGEPVWLSAENNWTYTWEKLPKKSSDATPLDCYYAVKELTDIPGFTVSYGDPATEVDQITQTITNKLTPTDGSISVQKQWQNASGSHIDPPEGASATLQLYQLKGTKTAVGGAPTVPVTITLTDGNNTKDAIYQVKDGSTFRYSVMFWCIDYWDFDNLFTLKPESAKKESLGTGWFSNVSKSYRYVRVSDEITVNGETNICFSVSQLIYIDSAFTENGKTIMPPEFSAEYEGQTYETTWETEWNPYLTNGTVTLSRDTWSHTWHDLPMEEVKDGTTYVYRYCVKETACSPEGYSPNYSVNGALLDDPENIPEDFTGGVILVTNREYVGGPELPKAGSQGTGMYTMGGLLLSAAAGFLGYYHIKRRKEDFASS